jgi:hypothetical protein
MLCFAFATLVTAVIVVYGLRHRDLGVHIILATYIAAVLPGIGFWLVVRATTPDVGRVVSYNTFIWPCFLLTTIAPIIPWLVGQRKARNGLEWFVFIGIGVIAWIVLAVFLGAVIGCGLDVQCY